MAVVAVDTVDKGACEKYFGLQQRENLDRMTFDSDTDAKYCRVRCLSVSVFKLALNSEHRDSECVLALTGEGTQRRICVVHLSLLVGFSISVLIRMYLLIFA